MRRLLLALPMALGLFLALAAPASAQLRQGRYSLEGQNPDGSTYSGQFELVNGPSASWFALWSVGNVRVEGIGLIQGGMLSIGYVINGRPGAAAIEVERDGKLRCIWTVGAGIGSEVMTPIQ